MVRQRRSSSPTAPSLWRDRPRLVRFEFYAHRELPIADLLGVIDPKAELGKNSEGI